MTPEGMIKSAICEWLAWKGFFFWVADSVGIFDPKTQRFRANQNPYRIKGVSDILGVLPGGRILAIEVKTPVGRVSPEQRIFIDMVNDDGGVAFVARSIADVEREFKARGISCRR